MYDYFISYKSENSNEVRSVVDYLIGNGLKVWFFEYDPIVFVNNTPANQRKFLEAIAAGIEQSKAGVCFTHDGYFRSDICQLELKTLFEKCGRDRIIEVKMTALPRDYDTFPELDGMSALEFVSAEETARHLIRKTGSPRFSRPNIIPPPPKRMTFRNFARPYSLDVNGWKVGFSEEVLDTNQEENFPAATLDYKRDIFNITGNLLIGSMTDDTSRRAFAKGNEFDERWFFTEVKEAGYNMYCQESIHDCIGAHLYNFPAFNEHSQIAITAAGHNFVSRLYSLVVPLEGHALDYEFVFNFFVHGPKNRFHIAASLLDRLVCSMQWA